MYKFGTIVLIPFPFTDLTSTKLRPALIISRTDPKGEDIVVVFITSRNFSHQGRTHFALTMDNTHFAKTGLKTDSIFRCDKIATLSKKLILGELGALHPSLLKKVEIKLNASFGF